VSLPMITTGSVGESDTTVPLIVVTTPGARVSPFGKRIPEADARLMKPVGSAGIALETVNV
jgi:hypothetical protein